MATRAAVGNHHQIINMGVHAVHQIHCLVETAYRHRIVFAFFKDTD